MIAYPFLSEIPERDIPRNALRDRGRPLNILSVLMVVCLAGWGCDSRESPPVPVAQPVQAPNSLANSSSKSLGTQSTNGSEVIQNKKTRKIVAFGDSLTAGLGVATDEAYPAQLEKRLREAGYAFTVINAGVSGETSAGGLRRVTWILKSHPDYVILELGANDGLRGQSIQQTYENLRGIMTQLQEQGVQVILAGMQIPLNYGEDYTTEFTGMYERLAKELNAPFIPFFLEGVAARPELNQGDGIHPTGEGYSLVVQNVWKVLVPLIQGHKAPKT